jgi:hypothetical protein
MCKHTFCACAIAYAPCNKTCECAYDHVVGTYEKHTPNRVIRVPDDLWHRFGELTGERNRSQVIREFIAWYCREPRSHLPERPPRRL